MDKEKLIDLHVHSNYSDGDLSVEKIISLAIKNNIGTLAITDHNTIDGLKAINRNSTLIVDSGIKIIDGVELSANAERGQIHILGYGFDLENSVIDNKLRKLRKDSIEYFLFLIEHIKNNFGLEFCDVDIDNLIKCNRNLGRPDIAKLCVKYGYVQTVNEAFDKYLIKMGEIVKSIHKNISYKECIQLILNSGGIPVLAHPITIDLEEKDFLILLRDMIECGLQGIEVYHSIHSKEKMAYYLKIANEYKLLISGGSDFHGKSVKPEIELGYGKKNLKILKLSILDRLK